MFNKLRNKKTHIIATSMALMTILFAATSEAGYVDPGSESDPIVSKTYVDKKINDLKTSSDARLEKITKDIETIKTTNKGENNQSVSEIFKVLELKKGDIVIADESSEIIVRSGIAQAIAGKSGGLSDITEGIDLTTDDEIKLNHLLIVPRSDGRGIKVKADKTFIMIKGKYTVN